MEAEDKKDLYNEAKLELVSDMMAIYAELLGLLGILDFEHLPVTANKTLLNSPAVRKLEITAG